MNHNPLDRTFAALADPNRRAILVRLAKSRSLSVSELAARWVNGLFHWHELMTAPPS